MRKWHRVIAPFFAVLLLAMAVTGLAIQAADLLDHRSPAASLVPHASASEADPLNAARRWGHLLKQIHSGKAFGPLGIAVNLLCGVALLFFAGSGLWMYLSMAVRRWRRRRERGAAR